MLPFWESKQPISYTELQSFRECKYQQHYPPLVERVKENLKKFSESKSRYEAFKILLTLSKITLYLSCYNSNWITFDNAVFESLVIPSKSSIEWTHKYLYGVLDTTLTKES